MTSAHIISPPVADQAAELKRGAIYNALAVLASNFRGIFTFLVARLLGPAALGTYMVAWAAVDVISRFGILALDVAVTTFIARAEVVGDRARSRSLFQIAVWLVVAQCAVVAAISIVAVRLAGERFGMNHEVIAALSVMLCCLPGLALYRMSTAVSRGMKVMRHDIFSRGLTDSFVTTVAFLAAFALGWKRFAPELALIAGAFASGIVAYALASTLFRSAPEPAEPVVVRQEISRLFAFAAPISVYDLINSAISRLDVILLAGFIGRAPGVTLTVVGIYGAVVEIAIGLRKVNQAFNPIFGPIVAGITVHGEQTRAAAAFARLTQWMLWILLPLLAVMFLAGSLLLWIYGAGIPPGRGLAQHRRARLRGERDRRHGRNRNHGAAPAPQSLEFRRHLRDRARRRSLADLALGRDRCGARNSAALCAARVSALGDVAARFRMEEPVERSRRAAAQRALGGSAGGDLPPNDQRNPGAGNLGRGFSRDLLCALAPPSRDHGRAAIGLKGGSVTINFQGLLRAAIPGKIPRTRKPLSA